jgi:DNA-binding NarL/FixJ family response regulator
MTKKVLIVDDHPQRVTQFLDWLRGLELLEATSAITALASAEHDKPDLIILRIGLGIDLFHKLAGVAKRTGTFVAPIVERSFSPDLRNEVLNLKADGFIFDESPGDEKRAAIEALLRKKQVIDELQKETQNTGPEPGGTGVVSESPIGNPESKAISRPLRERSPALYQEVLRRYEDGIKLVLQNRIYKVSDDIFEPFRLIAKQLFEADATARDAVELHYQTLRKIAPTPDAPRAQAYLEVGRTTIIGLMGDLITCYRETSRNQAASNTILFPNALPESLNKQD